ncbi:MAG: ATPase, T2SS/T4P/T4SS family, partial [Archangium sp.]
VLNAFLDKLRSSHATDLTLRAGEPPTLHSPTGPEPLGNVPLAASDVRSLIDAARPPMSGGREVWTQDRIRFVVASELGGPSLSLRKLAREVPSLEALGVSPLVQTPLLKLKRGLVLLSGEPGSARTTLYSSLLSRLAHEGRRVASLEEPLGFELPSVRQAVLGEHTTLDSFVRTTRLQPLDVVGFDLLDDAKALEHALEAALDGRLAVCVFRAPNVSTAVHRAAVLDARFHRRRLAEHLAAVSFQRLAVYDVVASLELDFHLPSVSLRRHLRAQETPPPPVAFEGEHQDG